MSSQIRSAFLLALGMTFATPAVQADDLALERRIWANPELSHLALTTTRLPGGGLSVHARAGDRAMERNARAWLETASGVESFQVDFDPRLGVTGRASTEDSGVEAAKAALTRDAGTREFAGLLDDAELDREGVLTIPAPVGLEPGTERRLARLLLSQPGIAALRHAGASTPRLSPSPAASRSRPRRAVPPVQGTDAPAEAEVPRRRTRLELDPIQPEAAAIAQEEPSPRTRLHVNESALTPASSSPAESERKPETPVATPGPVEPVPVEEPAAVDDAPAPAPTPTGRTTDSPTDASEIDGVIEDLLARTMALKGDTTGVDARVVSGVVTMSGDVGSRDLALELRELARNFDGIRRVTGSLVADGESVPMDAVAD